MTALDSNTSVYYSLGLLCSQARVSMPARVCVPLCVCVFACLCIGLTVCVYFWLIVFMCLCLFVSVRVSVCLCVCLSSCVCLRACLFDCPFVYLFICILDYIRACIGVCLLVLSVCLYRPTCLSVWRDSPHTWHPRAGASIPPKPNDANSPISDFLLFQNMFRSLWKGFAMTFYQKIS